MLWKHKFKLLLCYVLSKNKKNLLKDIKRSLTLFWSVNLYGSYLFSRVWGCLGFESKLVKISSQIKKFSIRELSLNRSVCMAVMVQFKNIFGDSCIALKDNLYQISREYLVKFRQMSSYLVRKLCVKISDRYLD